MGIKTGRWSGCSGLITWPVIFESHWLQTALALEVPILSASVSSLCVSNNFLLIFDLCQHLGQRTSVPPHPLQCSVHGAGSSSHSLGRGLAFFVRLYCSDQSLSLPLWLRHDWSISRAPLYFSVMRMSYCLWVCVYDWLRAASTGCSYKPLSA